MNILVFTIVLICVWQFWFVQSIGIDSDESSEEELQYNRRMSYLKKSIKINLDIKPKDGVDGDAVQAQYRAYVEKFAPELRFDRAAIGYPMSVQTYYDAMKKDTSSSFRKENTEIKTINNGSIPTYYRLRNDGKQIRILYWWFYGYQHPCYNGEGAHNGDWEHIMVILTEDNSKVAAVSLFQHDGHYTRISGPRDAPCTPSGTGRCAGSRGFDSAGDHPVIYVGKIAHGSYHDKNSVGPAGAGNCAYYADFRNPKTSADYMHTWDNLVSLDSDDEAWMAADENGGFSWGPDGISTHPTKQSPFDSNHERACSGSPTYKVKSAGCYQSECLAGDDEASEDCLKECEPGYTNVGLTCNKGVYPWEWKIYGRLDKGKKYDYDYILPKEDTGLSRRRRSSNKSEWNLP
ncbi:hypothetical protein I4U23_021872 [Adineta vaga]|nr:hypothetical protein I4U23_021872 [Adineta vaga]